jgi:hypothetical protein
MVDYYIWDSVIGKIPVKVDNGNCFFLDKYKKWIQDQSRIVNVIQDPEYIPISEKNAKNIYNVSLSSSIMKGAPPYVSVGKSHVAMGDYTLGMKKTRDPIIS